jgi:hypothetical protein
MMLGLVAGFCLLLLTVTTTVHYEVLRLLTVVLPVIRVQPRSKLIVVIVGAFCAHAIEIFVYGVAYFALATYLKAGTMGEVGPLTLTRCLYFSGETFTSLGYGDIVPHGDLRLLAGMEALNGLLLIGWTASFTYIAMERFWDAYKEHAAQETGL